MGAHRIRRRPQFRDQPQYVAEKIPRNGDLSHLECDVAARADDLRADFADLSECRLSTPKRSLHDWACGPTWAKAGHLTQVVTSIVEFQTGSLPKVVESVPDTPAYSLARCPDVL